MFSFNDVYIQAVTSHGSVWGPPKLALFCLRYCSDMVPLEHICYLLVYFVIACIVMPKLSESLYSVFSEAPVPVNLCFPSPCGPNSQCKEVNGHAVCVCVQGYIGSPPNCRPECAVSSECQLNLACSNQKCIDPCPGTCGLNAQCLVVNHNPICTCSAGYTGDPFSYCQFIRKYLVYKIIYCIVLCRYLVIIYILYNQILFFSCNATIKN